MNHLFLDSQPLGLLSNPTPSSEGVAIMTWTGRILAAGHRIYVPEVIDYELRRELVRAGKTASIAELDSLKRLLYYLPITTDAMVLAAELWAQSRNAGTPTGDPKKLDIDAILAAQALTEGRSLGLSGPTVIVVTTNARHLSQFVTADLWTNIEP